MRYAMLDYSTPGSHDLPQDEFARVMRDYEALRDQPGFVASAQLHTPDMATTLRGTEGEMLTTDGPSPTPRRSSAATTCSTSPTSTPRWGSRGASPS